MELRKSVLASESCNFSILKLLERYAPFIANVCVSNTELQRRLPRPQDAASPILFIGRNP
eukprot:10144333-Alexandrium_andersonii.AAC.1